MQHTNGTPWRRFTIGVCLVAFLIAIYLLTFNGYAISRDEWFLFDATESMARRGNLSVNYEFDAYPPLSAAEVQPRSADTEPLFPVLAVPLFWIAQSLPAIGLAHTVWLFNILATALTAGVLYAYGLALGYRARVAAGVALLFGLGTIAWPYSRTFFREPLFTLLALSSAYCILRARQRWTAGRSPLAPLLTFAVVFAGALFSKEAAFLIIPVMIAEALPDRFSRVRMSRTTALLGGVLVAAGIALVLLALYADTLLGIDGSRYAFVHRLEQARRNLSGLWVGVRGYMFSPARSVWLFSPVLLLGFFGWPRLIRERRWRHLLVPLLMLITFTVGYAAVRGAESWYGGLGWGARYLVPVTPFLALWLLPVVDSLLESWARRTARVRSRMPQAALLPIGFGLIVLISVGIQILAALVPIIRYYETLEANGVVAFNEGAWSLRWSPLRVYFDLLGDQTADLAWKYAVGDGWLLPLLAGLLAVVAVGALIGWLRRQPGTRRAALMTMGGLLAASLPVLFGSLYAIRLDPRYYGDFDRTRDLLAQLSAQVEPDDAIVLDDYTYSEFFMNYYKRRSPVVYTLPQSPGEQFSLDQPPQVVSPNPEDLIRFSNAIILADLSRRHERVWLVMNTSPFVPWSVRPMEHYLARHYFPIREIKSSDIARAVLFDLTPAPPATATRWPTLLTGAAFGESLRLVGLDIPGDTTRRPGDVLPVSLLWETLAPVPQDYTVALFLMREETVVAQHDSFPVGGFEHTTVWRPGSLHRDNHGIQLPADLAPGTYELWAIVYWWGAPSERLPVSGPHAGGDHAVLATITIR